MILSAVAVALLFALRAGAAEVAPAHPHHRAVLVGIADHTPSRTQRPHASPGTPARDLPNLGGPVNDVSALSEMLVLLYGFDRGDIITLTDQNATRQAILGAIDHQLVAPASKGDVILFYFAGHGSQVRNSLSDEADKLDESLVPADALLGAADIRDKELRRRFNAILDRGARLTVILDNCHSGSGARGLATGIRPRGVKPDLRDVRDATPPGPRPEDRGALVLSACQDFDSAWETHDEQGTMHGTFSWALLRAMRDSGAGEAATDTFLRAQARMRAETPFQEPVMAGNIDARLSPLFGVRSDRRGERTVVAVEKVQSDGTIVLQGGWANGLAAGSELQLISEPRSAVRLRITALRGFGRSEARAETPGRSVPLGVRSGALLEVVGWAAPRGQPLRVWMPPAAGDVSDVAALARKLVAAAAHRGVRWVTDPVETTPTHLLRRSGDGWEMLGPDGRSARVGNDGGAIAAVAAIPTGSSLFVQFPIPAALLGAITLGPGTASDGIEATPRAADADYILTGRYARRQLGYAWVRPLVQRADRRKSGLPLRTEWIAKNSRHKTLGEVAATLRDAVTRLRRVQAWNLLDSPPAARSPYQLGLRRHANDQLVLEPVVAGDERYDLVFRSGAHPLPPTLAPRYFYAFTIDSYGKSSLLFPRNGSVENHFPPTPPPVEISLGEDGAFEVAPPYGVDTYFLLTTDEPLPNPWILEWDGVRTRKAESLSPLEQLLVLTGSGARSPSILTPPTWSIEKAVYESVSPRR